MGKKTKIIEIIELTTFTQIFLETTILFFYQQNSP